MTISSNNTLHSTSCDIEVNGAASQVVLVRKGPDLSLDKLRLRGDGTALVEGSLKVYPNIRVRASAADGKSKTSKMFGKLGIVTL